MRIGKFFSSRNKTATPRRIPDDSLAEIQTRTSRSFAKYSISFRFISRRGNFSFPLPLGSFSHRLFVRNPSLLLLVLSRRESASIRTEKNKFTEFTRRSVIYFVVACATEPAHSSFSSLGFGLPCHATICNFPLGVFSAETRPVHAENRPPPRRPDKSRWRNHLLLFAITHLVDYTKSIDTERVKS